MNWAIHLVVWWRVIKIRGLRIWCIRDPWVSSFYEWHQIRMVSWLQTYHDMIIWFWPKILPKNHHNFEIFIFLQKSESHRNYPIYKKRMVDFLNWLYVLTSFFVHCLTFPSLKHEAGSGAFLHSRQRFDWVPRGGIPT